MDSLLTTLAVEVIPACALRAIFGVGLKEGTNWSLRAAKKRTTLLLVWDEDDKKEKSGIPIYRENRGRKRRRETGPRDTQPTAQPAVQEEPAPLVPQRIQTVSEITLQALQEHI
ncbi:hypothetical protein ACJMK2_005946 [Sinanodonta woodiana]|uniref:Uncharacterized protein n=1 Tax=Sinanodonta woodiana TaxID=1069815 RepID=A0ABD3VRZ1_SINWO